MFVAAHDRVYNLASVGVMMPGGHGAIDLHLTGVQLTVAFHDTTNFNPLSMPAMVDMLERAAEMGPMGVFTWDELEAAYREAEARLARRQALRNDLIGSDN